MLMSTIASEPEAKRELQNFLEEEDAIGTIARDFGSMVSCCIFISANILSS